MQRSGCRLAVLLFLIVFSRVMLPALALPSSLRYRAAPALLPAAPGSRAPRARTQAEPFSTESHGFLQHLHKTTSRVSGLTLSTMVLVAGESSRSHLGMHGTVCRHLTSPMYSMMNCPALRSSGANRPKPFAPALLCRCKLCLRLVVASQKHWQCTVRSSQQQMPTSAQGICMFQTLHVHIME